MTSQQAEKTAPRLFISYSHDSREHEDRVRALADRLREYGVDAVIDQYNTQPPDGWPMWMDLEIERADFVALVCTETYLRRVEGRESPGKGRGVLWEAKLIYNHLYEEDTTFQKFIPILLEGDARSSVPWPIRGLTHYQVETEQGFEDFFRHLIGQPRLEKPALSKLKALPVIGPQSYPASLKARAERKATKKLNHRNRLQMLNRVRSDWIDGILKQSLYKVARLELGIEAKADAIEHPLNAIVQVPDRPQTSMPADIAISRVFDEHGGALLILGAPGTGKTTLLLELAQELLNRAEQDDTYPIPVVFNLSSWAVRRRPFGRWLIDELNERSDVPRRLAKRWVETEQILPLLDGLDEVAIEHRQACVKTINDFRREHGLLPIAVSSRIPDYELLATKLRLRIAVVVQPLTKLQVLDYMKRVGEPLQTMRAVLKGDPSLWEILETPLMLWVAMLAYHDIAAEFSGEKTLDQRRSQIFAAFVDMMYKRRSPETRYTQKQTVDWLSWLASALRRNGQTVFYLENLRSGWLATRTERWISRVGTVLGIGLTGGLIYWPGVGLIRGVMEGRPWVGGGWLINGLIVGLSAAVVGAFLELRPIETMRISLAGISSRLSRAVRVPVVVALIFGVLFGAFKGLAIGLFAGLVFGLGVGLLPGLMVLLFSEAVESRMSPNQGTHRSMRAAGIAFLTGWLTFGIIFGLMAFQYDATPYFWLIMGMTWGICGGLVAGLIGGGLFSLKHFLVRLVLSMYRLAPLNYVRFLDCSVERVFLRKVGGGYIFVHRMLQEYFASQAPSASIRSS